MIFLMRDAMVHPSQTRAEFTVESPDTLQHDQLTSCAYSSRTGSVGLHQLSKESRLRPIPISLWGVLGNKSGKTLPREVAGWIGQLACPHECTLYDVLDELDSGSCTRGRPKA